MGRKRADANASRRKKPRRWPLVVLVIIALLGAGVMAAYAVVTLAARTPPSKLAKPLQVYPVAEEVPGTCQTGDRAVQGQDERGQRCYHVSDGVTIKRVEEIRVQQSGSSGFGVSLSLLPADRRDIAELTERVVGRPLLFVVNGKVVTAPRVDRPITEGRILISGEYTKEEAYGLARSLTGTAPPPVVTPAPTPCPSPSSGLPGTPGFPATPGGTASPGAPSGAPVTPGGTPASPSASSGASLGQPSGGPTPGGSAFAPSDPSPSATARPGVTPSAGASGLPGSPGATPGATAGVPGVPAPGATPCPSPAVPGGVSPGPGGVSPSPGSTPGGTPPRVSPPPTGGSSSPSPYQVF